MKLGVFLILVGIAVTFINLVNARWWIEAIVTGDVGQLCYYSVGYAVLGVFPMYAGSRRLWRSKRGRKWLLPLFLVPILPLILLLILWLWSYIAA